ncbi:MAG: helix-turn-helix domain-containing protein [Desulfobaccales bacterium]|jgi:excisionase family DNA binding protein
MQDKEVLTSEEAAAFLGVSAFTIREYAKRGTIPGRKEGNRWFFYKPDLVAWVRGKESPPQEPDYAKAWYNLGVAYAISGNRSAALEAAKELRRYDPQQADKLFDLIMKP